MRRLVKAAFVLIFLAAVGSLSGAPLAPPAAPAGAPAGVMPGAAMSGPAYVFVSTFNGNSAGAGNGGEILSIDTTSGVVTEIHNPLDSAFLPEDIAIGPDGKIYVMDSVGDRVFRMDQDGSNVETVFDLALAGVGPAGPEGPSFLGSDLYFNTRGNAHSGIWKIAGVAAIPTFGVFPAPVNLFTATDTGSNFGEGTAFAINGDLLVLDRQNQRLLRSSPPFTTLTPFISGLGKTPFGVAVNSVGEIFISVHDANPTPPAPLTGDILKFSADGLTSSTFVTFSNTGPNFMEFDADDTLWVATADQPTGVPGRLLRIEPSGIAFSVATGLLGGVGIAVPPTQEEETESFSPADPSQVFNFGNHSVRIRDDIVGSCDVTVTAVEVSPQDLAPRFANFFPNAQCVRYPSKGGNCVVYEVSPSPLPACFTGNIDILIKYFTTDAASQPAMLHDPLPDPPDDFNENVLISYLPLASPDDPDDPGMRGGTDNFSGFVAVNLLFTEEGSFQGFQNPLRAGGTYRSGRDIPVKFRVLDDGGGPMDGVVANIGVVRISPDFDVIDVQAAGNSNAGTLFRSTGKGNYQFNLKTTGYVPGTYAITVSSNVFPPQTIEIQIR